MWWCPCVGVVVLQQGGLCVCVCRCKQLCVCVCVCVCPGTGAGTAQGTNIHVSGAGPKLEVDNLICSQLQSLHNHPPPFLQAGGITVPGVLGEPGG